MIAAALGNTEAISLLVKQGVGGSIGSHDFNRPYGYTALMLALMAGKQEAVKLILQLSTADDIRNQRNDDLLLCVLSNCNSEALDLLIEEFGFN